MTTEKLNEILKDHELWLESKGENGKMADLHGADLRGADLHIADLRDADLSAADLRDADLHGANLVRAVLVGANLSGVDLRWADLRSVSLRRADLRGAMLESSSWDLESSAYFGVLVDKRIAAQIALHFCQVVCDDPEVKQAQQMLAPLANQYYKLSNELLDAKKGRSNSCLTQS